LPSRHTSPNARPRARERGAPRSSAGAPSRWRLGARIVWGALLALHLWPIAKVTGGLLAGDGGFGALAALLATQALFAAKFADVRWLRLPSRRAALVAFLIATCCAHPEVAFEQLGHAQQPAQWGAALATLAAAPAVARAKPCRWLARFQRFVGGRLVALWRDTVGVLARPVPVCVPIAARVYGRHSGRAPPPSIRL